LLCSPGPLFLQHSRSAVAQLWSISQRFNIDRCVPGRNPYQNLPGHVPGGWERQPNRKVCVIRLYKKLLYALTHSIPGHMMSGLFSPLLSRAIRTFALGLALTSVAPAGFAQIPASPPIADPRDTRFQSVTEDWSTPSLKGSNLIPIPPIALVDDSHPDYTVELVQVQWRWGDPIDLYVIKPKRVKRPGVILNLYGYPADTDPYKNEVFQKALVEGGSAAVGFVSALTGHRYHDRPMKEWFLSELQECLAKSAHDVQMVLNYLAVRGDLDMDRIGMFGQGSGAAIAILASAADPRIKVLDILDPWGDWPVWMSTSPFVPEEERPNYIKPEFLKKVAPLDPLEWLPNIRAKEFRFRQNTFELDTPTPVKDKLRAAVPAGTSIVQYKDIPEFVRDFPHSTDLRWIEAALQPLPENGAH